MASNFDICIRGAGIVGRTLALLLARERLRVALVDAKPAAQAASVDIRAYALNQRSHDLLASVRCWPEVADATPVTTMHVNGDEGGAVRFSAHEQGTEALTWIVDVAVLEKQLSEAVRFQPQIEVFATAQPATLTVVCEGKASATREEFGVHYDTTPYGQTAIAARVRADRPHGQAAHQWFTADSVLGCLPMGGENGNLWAIVWSVPHDTAPELLDVSDTEFCERLGALCGHALGALTLSGPRASWPLQHATADRWSGRHEGHAWVLAGDAAHTVHPLAGQGLNLGLADASELATQVAARDYWRSVADDKLLRRYERARKTDVLAMGRGTDAIQRLFSLEDSTWRRLRNVGMSGFDRTRLLKLWATQQAMG